MSHSSLFVSLVLVPLYGRFVCAPLVPCCPCVCPRAAERIVTRCAASAVAEDSLCPGRDFSSCQMLMPPHMREKRMRCWQLPPLRRDEDQGLGAVSGRRGGFGALCLHPNFGGGQRRNNILGNIRSLISAGRLIASEVFAAEHAARRCAQESGGGI